MPRRNRELERGRLRALDRCLQALEEANERDLVTVPGRVAARLQPVIPSLRPGMAISDAITLVLREQEQYMNQDGLSILVGELFPLEEVEEPLGEAAARDLTERIKSATREVCMLLFEAHRRRAWHALGYCNWDDYVRGEFGLSRSRSYELLDQGRVIRAVMAAAGISGIPDISAYAAEEVKPYLPELIEAVRVRAAGLPEPEALVIVCQVVRERRSTIAQERMRQEQARGQREAADQELVRLREAINRLASMPPVLQVLDKLESGEGDALAQIDQALGWLTEFAAGWRERHTPRPSWSSGRRLPPGARPAAGRSGLLDDRRVS